MGGGEYGKSGMLEEPCHIGVVYEAAYKDDPARRRGDQKDYDDDLHKNVCVGCRCYHTVEHCAKIKNTRHNENNDPREMHWGKVFSVFVEIAGADHDPADAGSEDENALGTAAGTHMQKRVGKADEELQYDADCDCGGVCWV